MNLPLHPAVAARLCELREIMPELRVLIVGRDGGALVEYCDDDGVWCELIVPVPKPDRAN